MSAIPSVLVEAGDDRTVRFRAEMLETSLRKPITAQALGHPPEDHGYDTIGHEGGNLVAQARLRLVDDTRLTVTDTIRGGEGYARISRDVCIDEPGGSPGLRVAFEVQTEVPGAVESDWQFFIPAALYNRNDLDGDGREDYLGTYTQDVRDDKNGLLAVLARDPRTGGTFTLARLDRPTFDTAIDAEQLATPVLRPGDRHRLPGNDSGRERPGGSAGQLPVLGGEHVQSRHGRDGMGSVRAEPPRCSPDGRLRADPVEQRGPHRRDLDPRHAQVRPAGHAETTTRRLAWRRPRTPPAADPALLPRPGTALRTPSSPPATSCTSHRAPARRSAP